MKMFTTSSRVRLSMLLHAPTTTTNSACAGLAGKLNRATKPITRFMAAP
ncbi:MAG: hypothetical protein HY849_05855 [Nitrosomonadales bacterium]|nr:hypothetical protein [Nitrosomonadales bacterium]